MTIFIAYGTRLRGDIIWIKNYFDKAADCFYGVNKYDEKNGLFFIYDALIDLAISALIIRLVENFHVQLWVYFFSNLARFYIIQQFKPYKEKWIIWKQYTQYGVLMFDTALMWISLFLNEPSSFIGYCLGITSLILILGDIFFGIMLYKAVKTKINASPVQKIEFSE